MMHPVVPFLKPKLWHATDVYGTPVRVTVHVASFIYKKGDQIHPDRFFHCTVLNAKTF